MISDSQIAGAMRCLELALEDERLLAGAIASMIEIHGLGQDYVRSLRLLIKAREAGNLIAEQELLERVVDAHREYNERKVRMLEQTVHIGRGAR